MVMQNNMVMIVNELNNIIKNCVIEDKQLCNKEIFKKITDRNLDLELHDKSKKNLLHYAAYVGYVDVLEWLIENTNLDGKSIDENGNTALHTAVENEQIKAVQFLISHHIEINAKNIDGKAAVHIAAAIGNKELLHLLKIYGANITAQNIFGETTLHYAIKNNHPEIVDYLLEGDKNLISYHTFSNQSPLHYAIEYGTIAMVKRLLREKSRADINDKELKSPLHYAVNKGYKNVIEFLLDCKVNINAQDIHHQTPLFYAFENNNLELAELLISHGADINIPDSSGETILIWAVLKQEFETIKYIIAHGADLNLQDSENNTALHHAVFNWNREIVTYLIKHGAELNLPNIKGITPMSHIIKHHTQDLLELVEYFIKYNLNIDAQYSHGKTLLHYSVSKGNSALVELLVNNGIDLNIQDYDKKTALHYATEGNNLELVKYLISKGADMHILDINLENIFHYAAKNNNEAVMKYLAAQGLDINAINNNNKNALDLANIVDVPIFKTLLLLGVIINQNIDPFSYSKEHKELAEIANIAYFIYEKKDIDIQPLLKLIDKESSWCTYEEALFIIKQQIYNMALKEGYPYDIELYLTALDSEYKEEFYKIDNDLKNIITSMVPSKYNIGENIETDLAILLHKAYPNKFLSTAPYSALKNTAYNMADKDLFKVYDEYTQYKTENCFDYFINSDNDEEIFLILHADNNHAIHLFNILKRIPLYKDDFEKFMELYKKFYGSLEKIRTLDPETKNIFEFKAAQANNAVELLSETRIELFHEKSKNKQLEMRYAELEVELQKYKSVQIKNTFPERNWRENILYEKENNSQRCI
ncbi:Ankyrin repeat protein [Rickettsiales bacterium Ac37b]|nr:Ankyrin repeat protein [Rickettsiales bacterium Ac37b]